MTEGIVAFHSGKHWFLRVLKVFRKKKMRLLQSE